jgi:lipoic acid synthetase
LKGIPVESPQLRLPAHCQSQRRPTDATFRLQKQLRREGLHSVCEEARCPNRAECWARGHVTFMLLGSVCTRACRFCAVATGLPAAGPDPGEPERVARMAGVLGLSHVVLTSVNRDDLADGGASQFAATIRAIRVRRPETTVEVLTPDFQGDLAAVEKVCEAAPEVYNHNVETVPRLYRRVRPGASIARSRAVLAHAKRLRPAAVVKSGFMVGLGESFAEAVALMAMLRETGVDFVTIGQYLRPSLAHLAVERYWQPEEFDALAREGRALGFSQVASGPLVRSSYHAESDFQEIRRPAARIQV